MVPVRKRKISETVMLEFLYLFELWASWSCMAEVSLEHILRGE